MKSQTCIVAVRGQHELVIAADSQTSWNDLSRVKRDPKIYEKPYEVQGTPEDRQESMIIGLTGWPRASQIIRHYVVLPSLPDHVRKRSDVKQWLVRQVVPSFRSALDTHGWMKKSDEREDFDGTFLIGLRGHYFEVDGYMHVHDWQEEYTAVGCGRKYALGALRSIEISQGEPFVDSSMPPYNWAEVAVKAARRFSQGTGGRIDFLTQRRIDR